MPREYSSYQRKVIQRYYDNREQIDQQRLSELGTELFLASGKKLEKLWERTEETMQRLGVPQRRISHTMKQRDPTLVAEIVVDIESGTITLKPPGKKTPQDPAK